MTWVEPHYSREQVRRAGRTFVDPGSSPVERELARAIINNWRSAHGFPLNSVQVVLRNKVRRESSGDPVVAQRTKRLPSIRRKLERFAKMDLSRMHDIGGCRAVLEDIDEVRAVEASYLSNRSRSKNLIARHDDYLSNPKPDGYRGIHVVVNYQGGGAQRVWSGLRVEVQLRTKMQHAWATALETVDIFTRQALKSNAGDPEWMRFFALMSAEVAHREGQPIVPETPATAAERRSELRALARQLRVAERLEAYGKTVRVLEETSVRKEDRHFLLVLDVDHGRLSVRAFPNAAAAEEAYGALEGEVGANFDVVLVAVSSMTALRRAYPNYFLDTTSFVELVKNALAY
ncbi:RelA/SpoT domain-containing protein [Micromonospora echinospora]|uniref:RelA/SpoT domain-containing protein n=1 Tax=Micromonospora echinospora TaxID=1877 RepID=UPI0033F56006